MSADHTVITFSDKSDKLGLLLIFISSILLGIWAVRDTIALRNILLVVGAILGILYLVLQLRNQDLRESLTISNSLPLIMLSLMFFWVIAHYLFLSRYPQQQFAELTSTWLRAFLGVWLAMGTALAISKQPNLVNWLWVGIFISFLGLMYQYIPKALAMQNLYAIDHYGASYFFRGKINGVLAGSILIAGLVGSLMYYCTPNQVGSNFLRALSAILFCGAGMFLASYSYVYIFDTRNGIGLEVLILVAAMMFLGFAMLKHKDKIKLNDRTIAFFLAPLIAIALVAYFAIQQAKHNLGWHTMVEDVQLSIQIDKYPNWREPQALGYPQTASGRAVAANTYERTAWATAGVVIFVPENPLGIGILKNVFPRLLQEKYGKQLNDVLPSTHSAWVDLTLSYGLPGLFLLCGSLMLIMWRAISTRSPIGLNGLIWMVSTTLVLTYTVGEVAVGHGLEILIYWIAFLATVDLLSGTTFRTND